MNDFRNDANLSALNSLKLQASADRLIPVANLAQLQSVLERNKKEKLPITILGGGTNVIFRSRLAGIVLLMNIEGKEIVSDDKRRITLKVGAGENWHEFVLWCHHQGFHGLANLALIPGTVGAAPIQNIGAYGVEVAQFITSISVLNRWTGEKFILAPQACKFGYRDSIFKHKEGADWIIYEVELQLDRQAKPSAEYPILASYLGQTIQSHDAVLASVMSIRQARLPDPEIEPNVGSFFKNPIVPAEKLNVLRETWTDLPGYKYSEGKVKLPAAWLIDALSWRGARRDGVKVSEQHALVLVGEGAKTAKPYLSLASEIETSVRASFGISLEMEPRVLGDSDFLGS